MNQIERELREALHQRVEVIEPPADLDQRVARRVQRRSRRRVALITASGVAMVIGACAAVIIVSRDPSSRSDVIVTDRPDTTTTVAYNPPPTSAPEPRSGGSGQLSLDGPRGRTQSVWTGEEIVIWGGHDEGRNRSFADGAAFNPVNRTWRVLSPSPLDASAAVTLSVWAGDRVVFAQGSQAAAWLPNSNEWQKLPNLPGAPAMGKLIWTGSEILAAGNDVALRFGDASWRALPEPPLRLTRPDYEWTGTVLLVSGAQAGRVHIQQYDPRRDSWEALPTSEVDATAADSSWNGKELIVVNYDNSAAAYDPTLRRWRSLLRVPARFMEHSPTVIASPTATAAFMSQTIAVLDERNEWTPLPYNDFSLSGQGLVSTSDGTIWSVGIDPRESNGYTAKTFHPERELTRLETIRVGVATIERGDFTYQSARFEGRGPGPESTTVRLTAPSGNGGCVVTSTYVGADRTRNGAPVTIVSAGNREVAARQVTATGVEIDYTTSDIVRVECPEAGTTASLLRQLHPPAVAR